MTHARKRDNVFELRQEIAELEARVAALTRELESLRPAENEEVGHWPKGLLESDRGAAEKVYLIDAHSRARQNEGYAALPDKATAARLGRYREAVRDIREALQAEGRIELADAVTRTYRVGTAAEACEQIKRRLVSPSPQQLLWSEHPEPDSRCSLENWGEVTEQPVESVDSPKGASTSTAQNAHSKIGRMASGTPSERAAPGDGQVRPLSILEEVFLEERRLRGEGENPREIPHPSQTREGEIRASHEAPWGKIRGKSPTPLPARDGAGSCSAHAHTPARPRAPDTNTFNKQDVASRSVTSRDLSEGVPCPVSSSAQDPSARAPGPQAKVVTAIAGALLDPLAQTDRAAEITRLMAELIRAGGVCPPNPRFPKSDGRLHHKAARRIATYVVSGLLDWGDDVLRLIEEGAAKSLADPVATPAAWVYLVGTYPKILAEREGRRAKPGKPR